MIGRGIDSSPPTKGVSWKNTHLPVWSWTSSKTMSAGLLFSLEANRNIVIPELQEAGEALAGPGRRPRSGLTVGVRPSGQQQRQLQRQGEEIEDHQPDQEPSLSEERD